MASDPISTSQPLGQGEHFSWEETEAGQACDLLRLLQLVASRGTI